MKKAIVTGASRGIGYETCLALVQKKIMVVAVARTASALQKLEYAYPDYIRPFAADITDESDVHSLADFISDQPGAINILVNNAGALVNKPFNQLKMDDWQHMLDINLMANIRLTKVLLATFSKPAHIVNISSMGGFQGSDKFPGLSAYSVAKGAVSILSECLAAELKDSQISVNALCLGAVQTEMLEEAFPGLKAPVSSKEMGNFIADFAVNGSNFYNGKVLPVAMNNPE